jgi:hypothetical protein
LRYTRGAQTDPIHQKRSGGAETKKIIEATAEAAAKLPLAKLNV